MINVGFIDTSHNAFQLLAQELEQELYQRDGELADTNYELNKIEWMKNAVVLYEEGKAVACGALNPYNAESVELKRMYVAPAYRRRNMAATMLAALEQQAKQEVFACIILETGKNQPEAIDFYRKHGYAETERFGKYIDSSNSVCFRKQL